MKYSSIKSRIEAFGVNDYIQKVNDNSIRNLLDKAVAVAQGYSPDDNGKQEYITRFWKLDERLKGLNIVQDQIYAAIRQNGVSSSDKEQIADALTQLDHVVSSNRTIVKHAEKVNPSSYSQRVLENHTNYQKQKDELVELVKSYEVLQPSEVISPEGKVVTLHSQKPAQASNRFLSYVNEIGRATWKKAAIATAAAGVLLTTGLYALLGTTGCTTPDASRSKGSFVIQDPYHPSAGLVETAPNFKITADPEMFPDANIAVINGVPYRLTRADKEISDTKKETPQAKKASTNLESVVNASTNVPKASAASIDSDEDGLSDEQEAKIKTNPKNKDTDGDGVDDDIEYIKDKTNPLDKNDYKGAKPKITKQEAPSNTVYQAKVPQKEVSVPLDKKVEKAPEKKPDYATNAVPAKTSTTYLGLDFTRYDDGRWRANKDYNVVLGDDKAVDKLKKEGKLKVKKSDEPQLEQIIKKELTDAKKDLKQKAPVQEEKKPDYTKKETVKTEPKSDLDDKKDVKLKGSDNSSFYDGMRFNIGGRFSDLENSGKASLFIPLIGGDSDLLFGELGGFLGEESGFNAGLGYRHNFDGSFILGANGFGSSTHIGGGAELLSKWIDLNANYYSALKDAELLEASETSTHIIHRYRIPMTGFEGDIGFLVPLIDNVDTRLRVGYADFKGDYGDDIKGVKFGLGVTTENGWEFDAFAMPDKDNGFYGLQVLIPLGKTPKKSTGLGSRMYSPVRRDLSNLVKEQDFFYSKTTGAGTTEEPSSDGSSDDGDDGTKPTDETRPDIPDVEDPSGPSIPPVVPPTTQPTPPVETGPTIPTVTEPNK